MKYFTVLSAHSSRHFLRDSPPVGGQPCYTTAASVVIRYVGAKTAVHCGNLRASNRMNSTDYLIKSLSVSTTKQRENFILFTCSLCLNLLRTTLKTFQNKTEEEQKLDLGGTSERHSVDQLEDGCFLEEFIELTD